MRKGYAHILSSLSGTLYVGVTNNLHRRIKGHKSKSIEGFAATYDCHRLVYYEAFEDIRTAITREKQMKAYRREKKTALIAKNNPHWLDLASDWGKSIKMYSEP
jgi:putative endonuclease